MSVNGETRVKNILVMEDSFTNIKILAGILRKLSLHVSFVASSSDALNAIQQLPYSKINPDTFKACKVDDRCGFDAAILDNQVPKQWEENEKKIAVEDEGIHVAEEIRSLEKSRNIGKMMLFSYSADEDREKFKIPLFDSVFKKQITRKELLSVFERVGLITT